MKQLKKLLLPALLLTTATATMTAPATVEACGPFSQPAYNHFSADPYQIVLDQRQAIFRFAELYPEMFTPVFDFSKGISSKEAAVKDFQDAVTRYLPKTSAEEQKKMVAAFSKFMETWSIAKGNMKDYPAMPPELDEFRLYLAGCTEMKPDGGAVVPPSWQKLLQLPPEKRHFRTVWTHYMLGNYCKADLHKHYKNCRDAARAGFADTAGLARASFRNEIKFGTDPVLVVRAGVDAIRLDPEFCFENDHFLPWRYLEELSDGEYASLVADPFCREILLIIAPDRYRFLYFASGVKMKHADICAYFAYDSGNLSQAEIYLSHLEKPTLISVYLEAKIARYKGNYPRVIKKMHEWLEMAKTAKRIDGAGILHREEPEVYEPKPLELDVYGHLGNALVHRRDFVEAAEWFYKGKQYEADLEEILEIFLTIEEAAAFADKIKPDLNSKDKQTAEGARKILYLIGRRALREGKEDLARKCLPAKEIEWLDKLNHWLARSKDEKLSRDDRALALFNAAKIVRYRGMELYGTAMAPDYFPGNFYRYHPNEVAKELLALINAPKDYRTVPVNEDFRFHYRRKAALMALEAGELAEDKDLKALIHCFGGETLRNRLPASADIFYKRLVLQSRGTAVSAYADQLRWFPQIMSPDLMKEIKKIEPYNSVKEVKDFWKKISEPGVIGRIPPLPETKKENGQQEPVPAENK